MEKKNRIISVISGVILQVWSLTFYNPSHGFFYGIGITLGTILICAGAIEDIFVKVDNGQTK